ncbi:hypothetical protein EYF80_029880 [Liparis tanakae]|uniref:Uncharacterized protein n=1 Tax=Liparis tanakae TaxID=230148 RepID=A0A4Z2H514_9TELE|nr:hypothetical protein EYF80_029880 [Liparis tanakae]
MSASSASGRQTLEADIIDDEVLPLAPFDITRIPNTIKEKARKAGQRFGLDLYFNLTQLIQQGDQSDN